VEQANKPDKGFSPNKRNSLPALLKLKRNLKNPNSAEAGNIF
jgi:hypothetical protein